MTMLHIITVIMATSNLSPVTTSYSRPINLFYGTYNQIHIKKHGKGPGSGHPEKYSCIDGIIPQLTITSSRGYVMVSIFSHLCHAWNPKRSISNVSI